MKVFKFGGGVLKASKDVFQLLRVLNQYKNENLIVIVSAFNKVTSKFESLLNTFFSENRFDSVLFEDLKSFHIHFSQAVFQAQEFSIISEKITDIFREIETIFNNKLSTDFHFEYDRIVSYGEVLSSIIIYEFLKSQQYSCTFKDIREIIITDSAHKEAKVDWDTSIENIRTRCRPNKNKICVTQGFIACDTKGNTTTLGREGSDFTASVLAYALNAEEVIFWKDVEGIYNADPHKTNDFVLLPKLSYRESLEQAFYGAKILHPKTIKPLQNKKIPLKVKSFYKIRSAGTSVTDISEFSKDFYPESPIFILKENQILISVSTSDFSFISEDNLGKIFMMLSRYRIKVNLMQASAISFSVCVTNDKYKIPKFTEALKTDFKVLYNDNLQLITIRHYDNKAINKMIEGKKVILSQLSRKTARYIVK